MWMHNKQKSTVLGKMSVGRSIACLASVVLIPIVLAFWVLHLWHWDFSVPLAYGAPGADEVWQLVATKTVLDTGWVLNNPYLGAPDISRWYNNSGAQTSAIHSILMLGLGLFIEDAVKVQQVYYIGNFSLITLATFFTCRVFGVARLPAFAAGLLFAFTSFRLHFLFFAYLANYFIVPISLIPTIWIMQGKFSTATSKPRNSTGFWGDLYRTFSSKRFLLGILIIILTGVSDGYYAFFTLLLIGFATFLRAASGDLLRPVSLAVPVVYIITMFATVLTLSYPIYEYRRANVQEANQDQMKLPTDAEVYSPTLKLLVAPPIDHRVKAFADFGKWLVETTNFNRKFAFSTGTPVNFGTLGTILFAGALTTLAVSIFRRREMLGPAQNTRGVPDAAEPPLLLITAVLSLFVLLCSLQGGLGSLIALVYPSIRAYERFPLYLIFLLFLGAAYAVTPSLKTGSVWRRSLVATTVVAVTALSFLDQTPHDLLSLRTAEGIKARSDRFLAERRFVKKFEQTLPPNAMVYQYPFSQYLTNNKYYGWGAFGQLRLYLHSKSIRWSNGGAKGSPGDNWHERVSLLPLQKLISEIEAVGFRGFVVDRQVVKDEEYAHIRATMMDQLGQAPMEDDVAGLASWILPDPGYQIEYDPQFQNVEQITVANPEAAEALRLPQLIRRDALLRILASAPKGQPIVVTRQTHPEAFGDVAEVNRGLGLAKIEPLEAMQSDVNCDPNMSKRQLSVERDILTIRISNRSNFDWFLNAGQLPIRLGLKELLSGDGTRLRWDSGFRLPGDLPIASGESTEVRIPLRDLKLPADLPWEQQEIIGVFSMLQEGNAWFGAVPGNSECRISLVP